jgi:hypothetical protein
MNAIPTAERIEELAEIIAETNSWLELQETLAKRTHEAQLRQRQNPKPRPRGGRQNKPHRQDDYGLAVQALADAFERGGWRAEQYAEFLGLLKDNYVSPADVRCLIRIRERRKRGTPSDSQIIPPQSP